MTRITQKDPHTFVFESDHELETYFATIKYFDFLGKRYELDGNAIAVQGVDPVYSFAYAVNVVPVV